MKLFIHVGMHKTGSSSIQNTLAALPPGDPLYLLRRPANHSGPVALLFEDARIYRRRALQLGQDEAWARARRADWEAEILGALKGGTARAAILSAERLVAFDAASARRLRDFFAPHVESIEAIGYVRPLASYMASAFQQRVKDGEDRFDPERFVPRYRRAFETWDEVLGRENVRLRPFRRGALHGGDVVRDFARIVGARIPEDRIVRANDGLSAEAVALLYAQRALGAGAGPGGGAADHPPSRDLVARLSQIGGTPFSLTRGLLARVLERHREDVEWIEARAGMTVSDLPEEDGPGAVGSEADLLDAARRAAPLLEALAPGLSEGVSTPRDVARAIDAHVGIGSGAPEALAAALGEALGGSLDGALGGEGPGPGGDARARLARQVAQALARRRHEIRDAEAGATDPEALRHLARAIWSASGQGGAASSSQEARQAAWRADAPEMMRAARQVARHLRQRGLAVLPSGRLSPS